MQLETDRLILREFKATDWKAVHEYASDSDVVKFMEWGPNTVEETQAFIDMTLESQRLSPRRTFEFAVTLKTDGTLIGAIGLRLNPGTTEVADIGYCYNKKYWRQGYSSEACSSVIRMGFADLKLHRIWATCDVENEGSAAVLRKCGMQQEGYLRGERYIKGRWRDTLLFAVLREDWQENL